jgi:cyclophilin family peptidyl-prolyl cis-trans isomerase
MGVENPMNRLCAALLCFSLAAGAQGTAPAPAPAVPAPAPEAPQAKPRVLIQTSYGPITLELEPGAAPATVANFLHYVQEGFYAGTIFHRVIDGFMVQGGGLLPDLTEKATRGSVVNEAPAAFKAGLKNTRGTIAMARKEPRNSATSQFYINTADNPSLDPKDDTDAGFGYCVFGRVVAGMEAVDKIEKVHTVWRKGMPNVPEYAVRIRSVERLPQ